MVGENLTHDTGNRSANSSQNNQIRQNNNTMQMTSMKLAHSNINSIRNKIDDIASELSDYEIICISETKLNDSILTSNLMLNTYNTPIRKDRNHNDGGGLIIYIKNNIFFKRRDDLESNIIENIWVEIHSVRKKFLLGLFYRPPESRVNYWNEFDNIIEKASEENLDIIVMGDLNYDILKANTNSHFFQTLSKFNLHNVITEPTRVSKKSSTCIDLIITNHPAIITDTNVLPPFHSDHCTVTTEVTFKTYKSLAYKKTIWKYDDANLQSIKNKFDSVDWSFINDNDNINLSNEKFNTILTETAEEFIPKVSFTYRPNEKPWMDSVIRKHMRQRDRLYHKAKTKNTDNHWLNFKNKRNQVVQMVRDAKKSYMNKLQNKLADPNLSSKHWYKIANDITKMKNKSNPPPPLIQNGNPNIHPLDKAQVLNDHFVNISTIDTDKEINENLNPPNFSLDTIIVTEQDVKDQLCNLNSSKPGGPDEIMPPLIKLFNTNLVKPLTMLFNKSLQLGQVPNQWKMANVSAIFKGKGNENDPSNYRPISITSCIGKILEKIIFKYLYNYLQENEILTKYQSGFRPKDSTVNQLLEIYHTIIENLDNEKDIKFIFCDVSKAFDKVWHRGLIHKLQKYGITGNMLNWMKSYLSGRQQRVKNEGFFSTWKSTNAGVPQGSVLGPYLFLLYINDITENIKTNIRLFADDTSLYTVIENDDSIHLLNEDLREIAKWADTWLIILNPTKTNSMTFSRKFEINWPEAKFNNITIQDEKTHTHLGITFSADATWKEHIRNIYKKAAYRLNIMRMLKYDLDRKSLHRFYISFIRPTLEYGNILWDNCTDDQVKLLESIQLDAARIITGLRKGTNHDVLYKETGLSSLASRRKNAKLIQFYKILNNESPTYIDEIVRKFNAHNTGYNLRNSNLLKHPTPRTRSYQKSFFIATTDLWNDLDQELKNCTSLHSFKTILKNRTAKPPKYYSEGERRSNIFLCQLRNNKSQLNFDLCHDHLNNSSLCIHCQTPETKLHFLLECPYYIKQRVDLINWLISNPRIYEAISITEHDLLCGNPTITDRDNAELLAAVSRYIIATKRFD